MFSGTLQGGTERGEIALPCCRRCDKNGTLIFTLSIFPFPFLRVRFCSSDPCRTKRELWKELGEKEIEQTFFARMERGKKGGRTRRGKSRIILDRSQGARRKLFRPPSSPHFSFPTRDGGKRGPFSTSFSLVLFFVGNHNNSFHYSLLRLGQIPLHVSGCSFFLFHIG